MNLLVGIDLSESTEKVIEKAEELAKALAAQVWLLHVAEPEPDFVGLKVGPQTVRDSLSQEFHDEHRRIQEFAERLRRAGIETTALLVQGATAETILKKAAKLEIDIIIVGSHGRGAMYQLLVGSVSETVLHQAECPVLVVPTRKEQ
jgi:nucleotide-binding universal stress UspA family protein